MAPPPASHLLHALLLVVTIGTNLNRLCDAKPKNYRNWRILEVGPVSGTNQEQALTDFLDDHDSSDDVKVVSELLTVRDPLEIAVSPYALNRVRSYFDATSIPYTQTANDLQRSLGMEWRENTQARAHARRRRSVSDNDVIEPPHYYMLYDQINDYMERVVNASRGRAELFYIGKSYEGRSMYGVKVNNGTGKPKVWVDAGIHAREWIAPATALHTLHQLVFNQSNTVRAVADSFTWLILPLANPDGYQFTWTDDRLWRKNRRSNGRCPDPCKKGIGVDLNRNFDFNWGRHANRNPCSEIFPGTSPFSEPESRNMRGVLMRERHRLHVYISLHSFMQLWVLPWAGLHRRSPDYPELERVANESSHAMLAVHGEYYQVVNFPEQLYLASGSSMDWAKKTAGVKYSYTIELRPNTRQPHFAVSFQPSQIKPTGEEVMAGILTTARLVKQRLSEVGEDGL